MGSERRDRGAGVKGRTDGVREEQGQKKAQEYGASKCERCMSCRGELQDEYAGL